MSLLRQSKGTRRSLFSAVVVLSMLRGVQGNLQQNGKLVQICFAASLVGFGGVDASRLTNRVFQWTRHPEDYTSSGKSLTGHTFFTYSHKYVSSQCALECLRNYKCRTFNFDRDTGRCELNDASHVQYPNDLADVSSSEYHVRDAFSIDPEALGPCAQNPCDDRGHCIETKTTTDDLMAVCICHEGWTGTQCQLKANSVEWGEWEEWGQCSVTCHRGWRMRTRKCEDTVTQQTVSSLECYGADVEYGVCEMQECPKWEEWGEWGECSASGSCGRGIKVRHRACSNGGVPGVDRYCLGSTNQSTPCEGIDCRGAMQLRGGVEHGEGRLEVYNDLTDKWGLVCADQMTTLAANLACKQLGFPGAHAAVTDGRFGAGTLSFALNKLQCKGRERNLLACPHNIWAINSTCSSGKSTAAGVQCNVNGVWSLWSAWSECSVTCENGTRHRTRKCDHPPQMHAAKACEGEDIQFKPCTLDMCPIDGAWDPWLDWSPCSVSCSNGTQERNRTCRGPLYGGEGCVGPDQQSQWCMPRECPVDGVWDKWGTWSECTLTCGNGTRSRSRTCLGPFFGGRECEDSAESRESCNDFSCPVDGEWFPWQQWQPCNVTCGGGVQIRERVCNTPKFGGKTCDGVSMETRECGNTSCPIDGVWRDWSKWSTCSVTCGNGTQYRNRTCYGPHNGGAPCVGNDTESQICHPRMCPVDCHWMDWEPWSACTVTCGGGSRTRMRKCYTETHGGKNCEGEASETGECNTQECGVDGVWLEWGEWSTCSQTCGNGTRKRERSCKGPFFGGANCTGPWYQSQNCNPELCPVDGVWEEWVTWSQCIVTCGTGSQWRVRNCTGPFYGGADCPGPANETQTCNDFYCPVDGMYSDWSEWGSCSETCGGGSQERNRTCTPPQYGGQDCQGPDHDTQSCSTHNCPIDGYYYDWSKWSTCSVTCGGGSQSRDRVCKPPKYGGKDCQGPADETQDCNTQPCPIDGVWKDWSDWSACNTTCGGGTSQRLRKCVEPKYGGKPCAGAPAEFKACAENPCPIPGNWFSWTPWSPCSTTCGGGQKNRSRECDMTSYGDLTAPCEGENHEIVDCHTFPCQPYACTCSEWRNKGLTASTYADIDPDGLGPVEVYCDMASEGGRGVTVIGHDSEERTRVKGYEGAMEYDQPINYNVSLDRVISVIDQSEHCSQFISWECKAALIHNTMNSVTTLTTGWLNRTYGASDYFGGATPGSHSCACGMTNSCGTNDKGEKVLCYCDINDEVWREDSGNLTYKDDLPITHFKAGDTGSPNEEGAYTLGRLYCWGVIH